MTQKTPCSHSLKTSFLALLLSVLSFSSALRAQAQNVDSAVQQAWDLLQKGDATAAERAFRELKQSSGSNERVHLGLSYLYTWQHRYREAWDEYELAMKASSNPHALFYSAMAGVMAQSNSTVSEFRLTKQYESLIKNPDSMGVLAAMAHSRLGDHARFTNDIEGSEEHYKQLNSIGEWAVIGPFENISGSGFNKVYEPEKVINMNALYPGRFGSTAKWFVPQHLRPDRWFDIERHFTTSAGVFYAYCSVFSEKKQAVSLRIGTSGAFKVFLNDELMLQSEDEYNNDVDTYICQTELQSGWNKVLVKLCVWEIDRNNFLLRIVDQAGRPIPGLRSSTEIQKYPSRPGAMCKVIPNSFEQYFEERLQAHPDRLENYLLLADCHLRNDKGEQAEMTLRDALKRSPQSVVLLDRMMEAYTRNDKRDLVIATLEKLWSIDSTDINALEFKFREAINNKAYEEAERLMSIYQKVCPNEEKVIASQILLYSSTGKEAEAIALLKSSYAKFPKSYAFASGMAAIKKQDHHDVAGAIEVWQKYSEDIASYDALTALSELYAESNQFSQWQKTRAALADLSNDAPGYHYNTARSYFRIEDYASARTHVLTSLEACPNAADYHELLGDIYMQTESKANALEEYKKALVCYPGYLKLREKIRTLENKKQVFQPIARYAIDSLVKTSPQASDYPDDESIIILDDRKYVLYPEGTAEGQFELLIRILKQEGIDRWKELNLGSSATIEKAVSMKASGSEIRADISKGEMVFKGLQEGDFIYVRYRDYERSSDRFFQHFSDRRFFNGMFPTRISRMSLITPKDYKIQYRSVNEKIEPTISSCDDGTLYIWKLENQAGIKNEVSMPGSDVVAKYVEITSIDSWQFIANWYCDVTNLKAKATYEIKEKMQELVPASSKLSDEEIVSRVYQFITDSIRYSYVPFRQSGGTPQRARDVLITKIGDCKDVATLGISMLSVAGIKADYCLVKTNSALMIDELPSQEFDHVIARVHLKSGMRYLDFTASNFPIGSLPAADVGAFSLLIQRDVREAQRISRTSLRPGVYHSVSSATMSENGDLVLTRDGNYQSGLSALLRYAFRNKGQKDCEKLVLEELSKSFPNAKLKALSFTNLDSLSNEVLVHQVFEAPKFVSEVGTFKMFRMPWFRHLNLEEEFSYDTREYPIEIAASTDSSVEEFRLTLPPNMQPVELPKNLSMSSALGDYSVSYALQNGTLIAKRVFVYKAIKVMPSDYVAVRDFVNSIAKEDDKQILLGENTGATKGRGTQKKSK